MSDREVLILVFGAIKALVTKMPSLQPIVKILEEHLFSETKKAVAK